MVQILMWTKKKDFGKARNEIILIISFSNCMYSLAKGKKSLEKLKQREILG